MVLQLQIHRGVINAGGDQLHGCVPPSMMQVLNFIATTAMVRQHPHVAGMHHTIAFAFLR
jgi:hypothetical protein